MYLLFIQIISVLGPSHWMMDTLLQERALKDWGIEESLSLS